jgi:hypothetical protein
VAAALDAQYIYNTDALGGGELPDFLFGASPTQTEATEHGHQH